MLVMKHLYSISTKNREIIEEQPLLCIPSVNNLIVLKNKYFQLYPDEEYKIVAKKLVYFLTGIYPEIIMDEPG